MKLFSTDKKLIGQTIGFPDLGDVVISEALEIEVTEEQYKNIEWDSIGWLTKEEIENLKVLPTEIAKTSKNDVNAQKTKSQEIEELKSATIKLIDENSALKKKDEQNSKDFEEATLALDTLNTENEAILAENKVLKAEIENLVKENTILRSGPEKPVVSEVKTKK
jgi:hypothetical protein